MRTHVLRRRRSHPLFNFIHLSALNLAAIPNSATHHTDRRTHEHQEKLEAQAWCACTPTKNHIDNKKKHPHIYQERKRENKTKKPQMMRNGSILVS